MRKVIILDNQSSASLFSNEALVTKVKDENKTLRIYTNAGNMGTSKTAEVTAFGRVWFDKRAIANIIAWIQIRDHQDYIVGSNYERDEFVVEHVPSK